MLPTELPTRTLYGYLTTAPLPQPTCRALAAPAVLIMSVSQGACLGQQDAWTPFSVLAAAGLLNAGALLDTVLCDAVLCDPVLCDAVHAHAMEKWRRGAPASAASLACMLSVLLSTPRRTAVPVSTPAQWGTSTSSLS